MSWQPFVPMPHGAEVVRMANTLNVRRAAPVLGLIRVHSNMHKVIRCLGQLTFNTCVQTSSYHNVFQ
jgi:hypothetical protein